MGWTFEEFDKQPADEVFHYLSLRKTYDDIKSFQAKTAGGQ